MMNTAFRTFLNLLLATSLAVTPVSIALAAMDTGSEQHAQSAATEPCHQSGHEHNAADTQEEAPMMAPCSCCGDDGSCPEDTGCQLKTASPADTLPIDSTANHDMERLFITALPSTYSSLNLPPAPPPPVA